MTAPNKIWVDYAECNKHGSAFDTPPEHEYQSCQDGYIRFALHQSAIADRDAKIARLQARLDAGPHGAKSHGRNQRASNIWATQ